MLSPAMMRLNGPKKSATPVDVSKDVEGEAEKEAVEKIVEMAMASSDELRKAQHSNDDSDDEVAMGSLKALGKSTTRLIWEYKHHIMGFSLLGLSWYNCDAGLELHAER
jgi:hypothetical protein